MNKRRLHLLIVVFMLCISVQAQIQIKGRVTNADNEPLCGAYVSIEGTTIAAITDSIGYYSFSYDGKLKSIKVMVFYVGCETVKQLINLDKKVVTASFQLRDESVNLIEVTVTSQTKAQEIREKAMPISVIDFDDLKGITGNVTDIVTKTSGVQMRRSGAVGSQSRISLRGLEGRRIGYFKDGVALGNNETYDLEQIPVDFIDRVEVYKGIVPAKFGGNAMGGALNIVIREYPPTYADIEYKYGSFNTHDLTFTLIGNKNGYELGAGGGYTYSDNSYKMELPLQKGTYITRDHDGYNKFCLGVGLTAKKRWWFDEVEIEPLIVIENKQIQGIEYNIRAAEKKNVLLGVSNKIEHENLFINGLNFEMNNVFNYANNTFVDTLSSRYGWDGTPYPAVTSLGGEIAGNNIDNDVFTVLQHTNFEYVINSYNTVNFNSQYNFARSLPEDKLQEEILGYAPAFNSTLHTWVTGLSYEFNSSDLKFTNAVTGRFYYYNMKTKNVPDMGLTTKVPNDVRNEKFDYGFSDAVRYKFTPKFLTKASFAYDLRLPSSDELVGDGFTVEPSEYLEPERNISINLGAMYDVSFSGHRRLQLDANVFAMCLKNMIKLTGGALQSKYENFGKSRTLGAELDIKWDVLNWLYLWGNITYQDLRDTRKYQPGSTVVNATKGERIPNIPYFFWNAGLELHRENLFGGKGQNTRFYSDCSFVHEYFYNFELSKYQEKRIPQSFTLNAGIEHSLCNRSIFLKLEVRNLTDEQVFTELYRPLPGRNFQTTVRYIWK